MNVKAVVLAAGKGTRLHSQEEAIPKVMREVAGRPMISYVMDHLSFLPKEDIIVVIGFMGEVVQEYLGPQYTYVWQREQKGTGHAVMTAAPLLEGFTGDVLVTFGDMPLILPETYRRVVDTHRATRAAATVLTALVPPPPPAYGRILRDDKGRLQAIVEQRDCTPEQLLIREVHVGVNAFRAELLLSRLPMLRNDNRQGEYYITDLAPALARDGLPVEIVQIDDIEQIVGINTPEDLAQADDILARRARSRN